VSKNIPLALQTHIAQRVTTLAYCLTITRADGEVFAMTEHFKALEVDGVNHIPGLTTGAIASAIGFDVDTGNFELIYGSTPLVGTADLLSGVWDGAEVLVRQVNWLDPAAGVIPHKSGHVGRIERGLSSAKVEFRDLRQTLRTDTSSVIQANCRARLGDTRCTVDLEPWTFEGVAVTSVADEYTIVASGLAQGADFFTEGLLTFTSGLNAGMPAVKVVLHEVGGVLTLAVPRLNLVEPGDTFTIIAGCQKRWDLDCRDKFDNLLNFQGEKDKPPVEDIVKGPNA
jgi:uncharacterized phage protein (TIGR02218 family)